MNNRPSAVCRLSVTLLHPRQRLEIYSNIFPRLIAQELGQFVLQVAQLSQRGRATLCVVEYFAKSHKVIRNDTLE